MPLNCGPMGQGGKAAGRTPGPPIWSPGSHPFPISHLSKIQGFQLQKGLYQLDLAITHGPFRTLQPCRPLTWMPAASILQGVRAATTLFNSSGGHLDQSILAQS